MGKALPQSDKSLVRRALTALNNPSVQTRLVSFVVYDERRDRLKIKFPQHGDQFPKMGGIFQYGN